MIDEQLAVEMFDLVLDDACEDALVAQRPGPTREVAVGDLHATGPDQREEHAGKREAPLLEGTMGPRWVMISGFTSTSGRDPRSAGSRTAMTRRSVAQLGRGQTDALGLEHGRAQMRSGRSPRSSPGVTGRAGRRSRGSP